MEGAGFGEIGDTALMQDALTRLLMRYDAFELGREVRTEGGVRVRMDAQEQERLHGKGQGEVDAARASARATARAARVMLALHAEHQFTDVWATDGWR